MKTRSNRLLDALLLVLCGLSLLAPVRVRAEARTLALFPLKILADPGKTYLREGLKTILVSRLAGEDLLILGDAALEPVLAAEDREGVTDPGRAEELARRLKADYAVFGSVTSLGTGYSLDLTLLDLTKEGARLARVSEAAEENQFIPRMAEVGLELRAAIAGETRPRGRVAGGAAAEREAAKGLFGRLGQGDAAPGAEEGLLFRPTREYHTFQPTGSFRIDKTVMAMDTGNLDGAGPAEMVLIDRKNLWVYQLEDGVYSPRDKREAGLGEDFLRVSVGDVNNDGRAEIYLVSRYGTRATSTVLEWAGEFKQLDDRRGHLNVIRPRGVPRPELFFQSSGVSDFAYGPIYRMQYDAEGKLGQAEKLPRLKGAQFYTLALVDLNADGRLEWIGLGEESRLHVWSHEGEVLWRSEKKVGGTNNYIKVGTGILGDPAPSIYFNSRVLAMDIDADGKDEILAIANIPLIANLRDFVVHTKANLTAFRVEGVSLVPAWVTGDIDYALMDIQADGPTLFLAGQKGKVSDLMAGSSEILWFE